MMDDLEDQGKPEKELNRIWDWPNTGLREHHRERFERLKAIVLGTDFKNNNVLRKLTEKTPSNRLVKKPDWSLIKDLIKQAAKDTEDSVELINILTFVVRQGEDKDLWRFESDPGYLMHFPQPSPHGAPLEMPKVRSLFRVRSLMIEPPGQTTTKQIVGDVLLNALCYSGVCSSGGLRALLRAILHSEIYASDSVVWISTDLSWRGKPDQEFRRILIDPMTLASIQKFSEAKNGFFGKEINDCLTRVFDSASLTRVLFGLMKASITARGVELDKSLKNFTALVAAQLAEMDLRIPSMFSYYASRKTINHSLTEPCWRYLLGVQQEESVQEEALDEELKNSYEDFDEEEGVNLGGLALKSLYGCYSKLPEKAELRARLENWLSTKIPGAKSKKEAPYDRPNIVRLLAQWQIFLIDRKHGLGANARPNSLQQMLYAVAPALVEFAADQNCDDFSPEDWMAIFRSVTEIAKSRMTRNHYLRFLHSFLQFLVSKGMTSDYGLKELSEFQNELVPVDAEIICEDEYQAILGTLKTMLAKNQSAELIKIMKLVFILGFRTGMRRKEVLFLRVEDLIGGRDLFAIVRENKIRTLKTGNSQRNVPLYALLTESELVELRAWIKGRERELKNSSSEDDDGYLFALPAFGKQDFREDEIIKPLHRVMREVTQRVNIRFHHLRHSAATWMIARLMIADHDVSLRFFDHLPETKKFLSESKQFAQLIYENAGPTRRHYYLVSQMIGHSGPDVSLEHYIHCLDWFLAALIYQSKLYDPVDLAKMGSISTSTAYHRKKSGTELLGRTLAQSFPVVRKLRPVTMEHLYRQGMDLEITPAEPDIFDVWSAMNMRVGLNSHPDLIYQLTGVDEASLTKYLDRCEQLVSDPKFSRVFRQENFNHTYGGYKCVPRMPGKKDDKRYARRIENILGQVEPHKRDAFISLYIDRVYKRNEWFEFSHAFQANEFLKLLFDLGFNRWDIKVRLFLSDKKTERQQQKYWRKNLSAYIKSDIEVAQETKKYARNAHGQLNVRLIDKKRRSGSPGLRFAVWMLLIIGLPSQFEVAK